MEVEETDVNVGRKAGGGGLRAVKFYCFVGWN